jgi:DNA-binding CsgD family transcriptional regulator
MAEDPGSGYRPDEAASTDANDIANAAVAVLGSIEPGDSARLGRVEAAVNALMMARRLDEAVDLLRATDAGAEMPSDVAARLQVTLSSILIIRGEAAAAVTIADALMATAGLPSQVYDEAAVVRLTGALGQGEFATARERAEVVLAGAGRASGDAALAGALTALAALAWDEGRVASSLGFLRAAVRRSSGAPADARHLYPRLTLATILATLGEFDEAQDAMATTIQQVATTGDGVWSAWVQLACARIHLASGNLDDAEAECIVGLGLARDMGARVHVPLGEWILASIELMRGMLREAAQHVDRYKADLPAVSGAVSSATYALTEARLADARSGPAAAVPLLGAVYDDLAAHNLLLVVDPTAAPFLVRNALDTGDHHRADAVVAHAQRMTDNNPGFASLAAATAHARGLRDGDRVALTAAVTDHTHPWAQASALEDLGVVIAASDRSAAEDNLVLSLAGYEQIGAERDSERVRAKLHESQMARRAPRRKRPLTGWASLSDTERRVADLVGSGLTNAEVADRMFISRHTVDYHLRGIFRKLQINSRVELARLVVERDS